MTQYLARANSHANVKGEDCVVLVLVHVAYMLPGRARPLAELSAAELEATVSGGTARSGLIMFRLCVLMAAGSVASPGIWNPENLLPIFPSWLEITSPEAHTVFCAQSRTRARSGTKHVCVGLVSFRNL